MQETWANPGLDLHLDLDVTRPRAALERALREAVVSGRLSPGTRLPSSRALGRDLGIARNTVVEAYGQLTAEGWLVARTGSGTHVAERVAADAPSGPVADAVRAPAYDLTAGRPDLTSFPRSAWLAAARRALAAVPAGEFGYGDPRGHPELRRVVAGYLARARGVRASPDRVVICSGFGQGLALVAEALAERGARTAAVESHGVPEHRLSLDGLAVRSVPVDAQGADVDALATIAADVVVLTPAHQFPLGVALAPARRAGVVGWAADRGSVVVEDDYDGEFRYDRQAVGALQALAPDSVVYAGTAAKTLAPGLRLGWLVLPAALVEPVAEIKSRTARHTGVLEQLSAAEFIASGHYDRHLRRRRQAYRGRRDQLVETLRTRVPAVRVSGLAAGLHVVVTLPAGVSETETTQRAASLGLAVEGLDAYALQPGSLPPALVVGYATPPPSGYAAALEQLVAALTP